MDDERIGPLACDRLGDLAGRKVAEHAPASSRMNPVLEGRVALT
jgi:hypothetical protein